MPCSQVRYAATIRSRLRRSNHNNYNDGNERKHPIGCLCYRFRRIVFMSKIRRILLLPLLLCLSLQVRAQVNTDYMMRVGINASYYNDYVLAIKYFNQVISAKPYLAEPYFYRARAKYNLGDFVGAEKDAAKGIDLNPFITGNYEIRSLARIQQKRFVEAISDYETVLGMCPDAINLWRNYSLCSWEIKDYDRAMAAIDSIRSKSPNYTFAFRFRSEILLERGDTLGAIANLDSVLTIDKYDHSAYMARSIINLGLKRYEEVESDLTQAIKLFPDCGHYINRSIAREELGNLRGAMDDLDMAVQLDPDNALARMNRGLMREKVGDYNRAIEDYSFVLECVPDHIRARYARAMLSTQTGDWELAVKDLTKLINEFPDFIDLYTMRAKLYRNMGKDDLALADEIAAINLNVLAMHANIGGNDEPSQEEIEKMKRKKEMQNLNNYKKKEEAKNPRSAYEREFSAEHRGQIQHKDVYVELRPLYAISYYQRKNDIDAMVHYHRELEMVQRTSKLPLPLVITASEQALDEEQIAFHFKDIEKQTARFGEGGEEALLLFARGLDFYLVQDLEAAIDDFTQAIIADGSLWMSYYCRAVARYKQMESARNGNNAPVEVKSASMPADFMMDASINDYQLILSDLNKVIDLAPDFAYSYYNRGNILAWLKDYRAAIVSYNEAIAIEPNLAEAYYNRGLTYIFLGENARGVADLSKAGELGLYSAYNLIKRFAE